jgi:hypothetical protein
MDLHGLSQGTYLYNYATVFTESAIYKCPGRAWSDIIELLSFKHKSILAGHVNAKSILEYYSSEPFRQRNINGFEISEPQFTTD